ncbi:MAG: hypothetical protein JRJ87_11170, partial [Deltaproteobacteria bacterium]|nr:hypothetical protein [Deltaproteobacteria bacterium]
MHVLLAALPLFLLSPIEVTPQALPAKGKQAAIIKIESPGMYRITAQSPEGTACSIVDHLRGPFRHSGISGKENCKMDLLLDAGVYKLRLRSPKNGRKTTKIEVKPFEELNRSSVRLAQGQHVSTDLNPGQQASYWIRVDKRRHVLLRVLGRTAGEVRLWRDGDWVAEIETRKEI